jgi:pyruvate kinase
MALAPTLKRTKIVATIGPASSSPAVMEALIRAGVNALRLNMSHGTHEEHEQVIRHARLISTKLSKPLAVVCDLQGPKIRLGQLPADGLVMRAGEEVRFIYGDTYDVGKPIPVQHDISKYLKKGEPMFLRDGMVQVEVTKVSKGVVYGRILNSGVVYSKQGINLPDTDLGGDILTKKDIADIAFATEHDVDYIALSFVQTAQDIENLKARIKRRNADCGVIAKIETKAAVKHLQDIIRSSDVVMVARGDLAIETRPETVPVIQQRIIEHARDCQKIVIVATQMLESMISSPQPTRAEVQDVATAVVEGADAVMLSGETAMGQYPVDTVTLMRQVILYTELNRLNSIVATEFGDSSQRNAVSAAAISMSQQINARVILAETSSGRTARNLCSFRPEAMVVAVTDRKRVYQQMALLWGARSYLIKNPAKAASETMRMLREEHSIVRGEIIIRASGSQPGVTGGTDTLKLEVV